MSMLYITKNANAAANPSSHCFIKSNYKFPNVISWYYTRGWRGSNCKFSRYRAIRKSKESIPMGSEDALTSGRIQP